MSGQEAVIQLARMLGRERVARRAGLAAELWPSTLTSDQLAAARSLAEECSDAIARALLEEAAASDDVIDAASATAYLEDRLSFLGELLSEATRARVRQAFATVARGWG